MGVFTSKTTKYWPRKDLEFLKAHHWMKGTEIAKLLGRKQSAVNNKIKALGLPRRKCDTVSLTFYQKQLIFGSLLGDGSIVQGSEDKNARFSEGHSTKQKNYLTFKYEKLQPFSGKFIEYGTKWGGEVKFSTHNHPEFLSIRKLFYNKHGKKIIKPSSLSLITHPIALAMWFGDDGSKEKYSYRLSTGAYNKKELKSLINWLKKKFNIKAYPHKHGKYWYLSIREDKFVFSRLVKPYLPACMSYKLF